MRVVRFEDLEWEDPPRGYYLTDVKQKTLWRDEKTGTTLALIKFPEGVADKIHSHPEANQIVIGLSGEMEMPDGALVTVSPNSVYYFDKGENHGATKVTQECLTLFFWDGSPRPDIVE
jgi:quercetin dioxygenase-like cupin family protein